MAYFSIDYFGDILTTVIMTCIIFVVFFILDEIVIIKQQIKNNKKNSQSKINEFANIVEGLRTGRVLFEDSRLSKTEITTLVELSNGVETMYMAILDNDLRVIHNIIFKNHTVHVKKFKLVLSREKLLTLNDLASYIDTISYFKLKNFHSIKEMLKM